MSEAAVPFYTQAAVLDQFIHADHPLEDTVAVEVVLELLRSNSELRAYFIRNRPHPAWVPVLWDQGFFASPPDPIATSEGERLPFWDMQEYLLSAATDVPEYILRHVAAIQGHPVYIERAARGLTLLPHASVRSAIPRVLEWLEEYSTALHIKEVVLLLIKSLAREDIQIALSLFEAAMSPFPNPRAKKVEEYIYGSEAVSLLESYHFQQEEFRKMLEDLISLDASKMVAIFEAHLQKALRLEVETSGAEYRLTSWWWRSAIEPSAQNYHQEYKDDLLDFLRDSCEYHVAQDQEDGVRLIERYLHDPSPILRRLGLHLLRVHAAAFLPEVRAQLQNPENYDDSASHHEFMLLLQAGYSLLSKEEKSQIIGILLTGPPEARLAQMSEMASERGGANKEEFRQTYAEHWTLARLWMLKEHLTGIDEESLRDLLTRQGNPDHPEFLSWNTGAFFVHDVSPIPTEQLSAYSPEQLVAFLRQWQPNGEQTIGPEQISREGLADAMAGIVVANITGFCRATSAVARPASRVRPRYSLASGEAGAKQGNHCQRVAHLY